MGNPLLSDDSVGIKAVRAVRELLDGQNRGDIDVIELYAGGIRLMDALRGYDRAVLIDAMVTGTVEPGTVRRLSPSDLLSTKNSLSVHDMDLPTALELGRMLGIPLPSEIVIWGIEAKEVETFGEELTEEVAGALPRVVDRICGELDTNAAQ